MLAEARAEVEDLTTIKRLDVLNIFMEAIDMARTLADPGQMINGADKVAKMMGYYAPEKKLVELSVGQNVLQAKFQQMTDEELLEIAAGRAKVVDGEVFGVRIVLVIEDLGYVVGLRGKPSADAVCFPEAPAFKLGSWRLRWKYRSK